MTNDYSRRVHWFGAKSYLRILLALDQPILVLMVFVAFESVTYGANQHLDLTRGFLFMIFLVLGRIFFQREIGLFASEEAASVAVVLGVPIAGFVIWATSGFRPLLFEELSYLLGEVGRMVSFLISWPACCIMFVMFMFIPWMFIRGFEPSAEPGYRPESLKESLKENVRSLPAIIGAAARSIAILFILYAFLWFATR